MNPSPTPSDEDLDRLLASQLKHTSPEFEQRWRELRAGLVAQPRASLRLPSLRWLRWPGFATAAVVVLAVVLVLRYSPRPSTGPAPALHAELFSLDAALAPAAPLLDHEIRDAVIHLPAAANP